MAAINDGNPTMLDLAKLVDPDGKVAAVAEILNETNEVLDDMTVIEGNLQTGHRGVVRTGLPAPTWRKINQGVVPSKGRTAQITANAGMLEAYAEVDKALADLHDNTAEFRLSEDRAHIEGMNQEMAETLFYGNETTEAEAFTGLSTYYNSLSDENADNIIVGGGSGADNNSIWLVVWSPQTVFGFVPKGSTAGLQVNDKGQTTIQNSDGSRMEAYMSHYKWDLGLMVKDWRYVVRIPNIDLSDLTKDGSGSSADLPDLMYQALEAVPNLSMGRPAFYMSRSVRSFFRRQLVNATAASTLTIENVGGKMVEFWHGYPLRRVDALAANEAVVS